MRRRSLVAHGMRRTGTAQRVLVTILAWGCRDTGTPPEPVSGPEGSVALASGPTVGWSVHHDRNALRDSRLVGDSLVAIARAGTLLRFDAETLELTAERCEPVRCLGTGPDDELLAGLPGGRLVQVEPRTLGFREVARVAGDLVFVGRDRAGLVAVTVAEEQREVVRDEKTATREMPVYTVHDLGSGRTVAFRPDLELASSDVRAWLLDSARRLWLGFDMGEWGGHWGCVDLATGEVSSGPCDGVAGLIETARGEVLGFGGSFYEGWISSWRESGMTKRHTFCVDPVAGPPPGHLGPVHEITHLIEEPSGSFLVFTATEVFRTDSTLERWARVLRFPLRTLADAPDVEAPFPQLRAVHLRLAAPLELLASTEEDGLWRWRNGEQSCRKLGGGIPFHGAARLFTSAQGVVALDGQSAWRCEGRDWIRVTRRDTRELNARRVLPGAGGNLITLEDRGDHYRRKVEVHRRGSVTELPADDIAAMFTLSDNELWDIRGAGPPFTLWRVVGTEWHRAGRADRSLHRLRLVGGSNAPWFLHAGAERRLVRMAPAADGWSWQLTVVRNPADQELEVHDVLCWDDHHLLLATAPGLELLDQDTGALSAAPIPEPAGLVRALGRDRSGRIWMTGDGVWVAQGSELHDLRAVPPLGFAVQSLAIDPDVRSGVVLALANDALLWLRLDG